MSDNFFKINKGVTLNPQSSAPSNPVDGDMYYDSTLNRFQKYENGSWLEFSGGEIVDNDIQIVDSGDNSKQIKFDAGGTTLTSTTIKAAQTADRIITLPDATTTLVGKDTTDVLSHKSFSDGIDVAGNIYIDAYDASGNIGYEVQSSGGAACPVIQMASDGSTGNALFISNPIDVLYLRSNGATAVKIDNSQNAQFYGSVGIGIAPETSSALDVSSTTKGFLPPRMTTTQKNAISSPAEGLVVFDTTLAVLSAWNGSTWVTSTVPPYTAPTVQIFASGSGTYTKPTGPSPLYLKVTVVGGGGGGGGGGSAGSDGSNSSFGTLFLSSQGGGGGMEQGSTASLAAAGGNATGNGKGVAVTGGAGQGSGSVAEANGGMGGSNPLGGGGGGGRGSPTAQAGQNAAANTGGGGGGSGGNASNSSGGGGGAGGYVNTIVTSPASTYAYVVGTGGGGGSAGTSAVGGNGGVGIVIVEEFYQ